MSAAHYKLDNLTAVVDWNGLQIDGTTEQVMGLEPLADKWRSFGWHVQEIDGHDVQAIYDAIENACAKKGVPSCIVLDTTKGKGATFAEPKREHSSQPGEETWQEAISAAQQALAALD